MEDNLIISRMTASDVPDVIALQDTLKLSPWSEKSYINSLTEETAILYTAKLDQALAGFIAARLITSEFTVEILNIGVDPRSHRRKIGERLLLKLLNTGKKGEFKKIWLEVRQGNHSALAFYRKYGFYEVGNRKNFYRDPLENAVLMQKDIE